MTKSFLKSKSKILAPDLGSFCEIDVGEEETFEIVLDNFGTNDVLCITVNASPSYMTEEFFIEENEDKRLLKSDTTEMDNVLSVPGLDVVLTKTSTSMPNSPSTYGSPGSRSQGSQTVDFRPKFFRGEYSLALTTAHGLVAGSYQLTVASASQDTAYSTKVFTLI